MFWIYTIGNLLKVLVESSGRQSKREVCVELCEERVDDSHEFELVSE